jgi:Ca2+-binding RTX toxin-like protein
MTTLPTFDPTQFLPGAPINNPYYPLKPGTVYIYEGVKKDEETGESDRETSKSSVTFQTKNVAGVTATVVKDTAWANSVLEEDTSDLFAQDKEGNVWYLGEATTEYKYDNKGNFIGTSNKGSWEAGVDGALPGHIMKAKPQVGDNYYQEFAQKQGAVDQATVNSLNKTISTGLGTFNNVLQTLEFTELQPGVSEFKYFAPGVGQILAEEGLDQNLKPDFSPELASISTVTPDAFTSGRGTPENDSLDGDNGSNNLKGFGGRDLLQGFEGDDTLTGQDGNDFLVGGSGLDALKGGNGRDILIGGEGADVLRGDEGRDQFVFRTLADRGDLITDFTRRDVIVLAEIFKLDNYGSSNPFKDYLKITQAGSRTVVRIDADGDLGTKPFEVLATLKNTNANSLSAANFVL